MKKDLATPRPWKLNGHLIESSLKTVMRAECDWHGRTPAFNAEQLANAELIIRAVNNFESLLVACKFVLQEWDEPESAPQCLEMLRKAIANAEKQG